jgi:hypothetical protein
VKLITVNIDAGNVTKEMPIMAVQRLVVFDADRLRSFTSHPQLD